MVEGLVCKVEVRRGEGLIRREQHHGNLSDAFKDFWYLLASYRVKSRFVQSMSSALKAVQSTSLMKDFLC